MSLASTHNSYNQIPAVKQATTNCKSSNQAINSTTMYNKRLLSVLTAHAYRSHQVNASGRAEFNS